MLRPLAAPGGLCLSALRACTEHCEQCQRCHYIELESCCRAIASKSQAHTRNASKHTKSRHGAIYLLPLEVGRSARCKGCLCTTRHSTVRAPPASCSARPPAARLPPLRRRQSRRRRPRMRRRPPGGCKRSRPPLGRPWPDAPPGWRRAAAAACLGLGLAKAQA